MAKFWKWIKRVLDHIANSLAADFHGYPPDAYRVLKIDQEKQDNKEVSNG